MLLAFLAGPTPASRPPVLLVTLEALCATCHPLCVPAPATSMVGINPGFPWAAPEGQEPNDYIRILGVNSPVMRNVKSGGNGCGLLHGIRMAHVAPFVEKRGQHPPGLTSCFGTQVHGGASRT